MTTRDNKSSSPVVQKRHVMTITAITEFASHLRYSRLLQPAEMFSEPHLAHIFFALAPSPAQRHTHTN